MKILKILFSVLVISLVFIACQKDEAMMALDDQIEIRNGEEVQMVPFKGDFQTVPVPPDFIMCLDEVTGYPIAPVALNHFVTGNATHLGLIDPDQSTFTDINCYVDLSTGVATLDHEIIFMNKKGDGLKFFGTSTNNLADGAGEGYFEVVEGFGKFGNASGWINTVGNIQTEGGPTFSADGMVTQPNH